MRIKKLIVGLSMLGLFTIPAFAAQQTSSDQTQVNQLTSETKALRREVAKLRHEVGRLKQGQSRSKTSENNIVSHEPLPAPTSASASNIHVPSLGRSNEDLLIQKYVQNLPLDWGNPGQSFVSIGPYVNVPIQFSGNQLIINDPRINTDVALLKLRKAAHEGMVASGIPTGEETHRSHLLLSGILEGQAQYIKYGQQGGNSGAGNNGSSSDIDLSAAELDGFILTPSRWISGFFSFSYDNGTNPTETNSRVLNSNLFLNNAFIMFGDFTCSPAYGTLGQMYVPFGAYSSVFVTSPLTKTLGRTKARAFLVGYQGQADNAFYTALYAFKGDSHGSATSRINNGGINLGYRFDSPASPDINGDIGMGWIANIADSVGMQNTGAQPSFNGFAGPIPYGFEKIVHRVPALNLRALISAGEHLDIILSYIGTTTTFNPNDLNFNGRGARPWATNTEVSYTFDFFDRPSSVGLGYGQAREALAIGLPERRIAAVFNTSIWHNTIQALEFRHDINYAASDIATGSNVVPFVQGLGTSDNVVTLHFDLFF